MTVNALPFLMNIAHFNLRACFVQKKEYSQIRDRAEFIITVKRKTISPMYTNVRRDMFSITSPVCVKSATPRQIVKWSNALLPVDSEHMVPVRPSMPTVFIRIFQQVSQTYTCTSVLIIRVSMVLNASMSAPRKAILKIHKISQLTSGAPYPAIDGTLNF
ncbi:uncharacterized protein LOC131439067 [Malaya genurostris]|uniref:uncharacterized protein LOC131439067 n=1 Tax=Malaya genurostris TaxID=325434 RepID=UPI0026F3817E|nr:uncharacterized protein LOC131439067 [Malaya genurostris]